jgi:FkbM family methyltransferase
MKNFFNILGFIWNHPLASRNRLLAFKRFFYWQIGQKIHRRPKTLPFVEDSVLVVEKGMTGATGNIYTGLLEFEDMAFILHALRAEDTFVDIGANVGVYTVLAARNAGARVISFEPIPSTFKKLWRNIEANGIAEKVELKCYALGDKATTLRFTETMDTVNHVLGENEEAGDKGEVEVPVDTLDTLLAGHLPTVFKIDVEGFEWPALRGAEKLLASPGLKALVIELNGSSGRYGFDDKEIHQLLLSHKFAPYSYEPFSRQLKILDTYGVSSNTIYIKDTAWANSRTRESRDYRILNINV